jgi:uncharacterized protein with FMN-binding domain
MGRALKRKARKAFIATGATLVTVGMLATAGSVVNNIANADDTTDDNAPVIGEDVTVTANAPVYVRAAGLKLSKTASPSVVQPGGKTTYTYTLVNTGSTLFNNVRLKDDGCTTITGPTGNTGTAYLATGESWVWKCVTGALTADANTTATAVATPVVNPTASPSPTTTASSSPSPGGVTDGTYLGSSTTVTVPGTGSTYPIQVQAIVSGGRITSITIPVLNPSDGTSRAIANDAAPTLISRAIAAQSSNVSNVSGATYTTNGFKTSLASALAKAGL